MQAEDGKPLWTAAEVLAATGGNGSPGDVTGVSIDTRTLQPGDLYVAIKGDVHDGHAFVDKALKGGAAGALVVASHPGDDSRLVRVDEPLAALRRLGLAARARLTGTVFAVTGSVGKTGTKEALRACLAALGVTHASVKSYNNHWGVPLTLARMPRDSQFGVFEIGMNHAGEITPLTQMVRPQIAIITTVAPVHIEFFASEAAIADAKAEIFLGLQPGGMAILNRDNPHFDRLAMAARAAGAAIISFGADNAADVRLLSMTADALGSDVMAGVLGQTIRYRLGTPGRHVVLNSLAVLAALAAAKLDIEQAVPPLAWLSAGPGRGERSRYDLPGGPVLLIDESYNANPASMRAALQSLGEVPREPFRRRIAVLGDMRELGERSAALHTELAGTVLEAGVDLVIAVGRYMKGLYDLVPAARRGPYAVQSEHLVAQLAGLIRPGDAVMIKGSLGTRMAPLVDALKSHLASHATTPHKS